MKNFIALNPQGSSLLLLDTATEHLVAGRGNSMTRRAWMGRVIAGGLVVGASAVLGRRTVEAATETRMPTTLDAERSEFRSANRALAFALFDGERAHTLDELLREASINLAPRAEGNLHEVFRAGWRFSERVDPTVTRCGNIYQIDDQAYLDSITPCRRSKDLNVIEIVLLADPRIINICGRVANPCTAREVPTDTDRDEFDVAVRNYHHPATGRPVRPVDVDLLYSRNVDLRREKDPGNRIRGRLHAWQWRGLRDPLGRPARQALLSSRRLRPGIDVPS